MAGLDVAAWLEAYGRAWRERDPEAAAALFTEDAVYGSSPFRPASLGRDGIREYWRNATATQEGLVLRFGEAIVSGRRVAVEWWATMRDEDESVTLPGCLLLRFDDAGLCEELREYWHVERGYRAPPDGWGR